MEKLPVNVLQKIGTYLPPLDRLTLQEVNHHFKDVFSTWLDVTIEIRCDDYSDNVSASRIGFAFPRAKNSKAIYHVKVTGPEGRSHRIRTTFERSAGKALKQLLGRLPKLEELTIWDACLGPEFAQTASQLESVQVLRLWNCSRYFEKKSYSQKSIKALLALPKLKSILVLDSTSAAASAASRGAAFSKDLALTIRAPIDNLQLAGLHLPLKALEAIAVNLGPSLTRLSIGCTYGKKRKRLLYLKTLQTMTNITDLDLPPFIFHLSEIPVPDAIVQILLDTLPLRAFGFRHYNSSVLFRFIEYWMPVKIRVLRIHHNANRIPNFAQLGTEPAETWPEKKTSVASHYSVLSSSRSSIGSSENNNSIHKETLMIAAKKSTLSSTSSLSQRKLTIFAIEEAKKRTQHLRKRTYNNVDVIYTQECQAGQEVLGRMAEPMRSPHVYSKTTKREVRVIKGDLVRPIPLASLGMESDYEDWDD
uniref:F-box domain-containing protein n=1 Tax=Panagrellus redivivus TaxID=6233 RepID=A0A7E4W8Z7_PANRE